MSAPKLAVLAVLMLPRWSWASPGFGGHAHNKVLTVFPLDASDPAIDWRSKDALEESVRTVAGEVLSAASFTVLTGETTLTYLEDNGIDPKHVCNATCALKAAHELKASAYVSGSIAFTDGEYVAFIRLFDRERGRQLSGIELDGKSLRELRQSFAARAAGFFAPLLRGEDRKPSTAPPDRRGDAGLAGATDAQLADMAATVAQTDVATLAHVVSWERADTGCFKDVACNQAACLGNLKNLTEQQIPHACVFGNMPHPPPHCPAGSLAHSGICWNGPYILELTKDPWGEDYTASVSLIGVVSVISKGPDRRLGTPDDVVEKR